MGADRDGQAEKLRAPHRPLEDDVNAEADQEAEEHGVDQPMLTFEAPGELRESRPGRQPEEAGKLKRQEEKNPPRPHDVVPLQLVESVRGEVDTDRRVKNQGKDSDAWNRVAEPLNRTESCFVVDEDRVLVFLLVGQLLERRGK